MLTFSYTFDFYKHVVPIIADCMELDGDRVLYDTMKHCNLIDPGLKLPYKEIYVTATNENNEYVGFCGLSISLEEPYKDFVMVSWLVVDRRFRGKNYGSQLLKEIERYVRENYSNNKLLYVECNVYSWKGYSEWEFDPERKVVRFYIKNGYKEVGEIRKVIKRKSIKNTIPSYFLGEPHGMIMVKDLENENG